MKLITPDFSRYSDFFDQNAMRDFKKGELIFREGDVGDCMYVVMDGKVQISSGGKKLSVMEKGDIFGDMALIDSSKRSANIEALTNCRLASIDSYAFRFLIEKVPDFTFDLLRIMANRLRAMNIF